MFRLPGLDVAGVSAGDGAGAGDGGDAAAGDGGGGGSGGGGAGAGDSSASRCCLALWRSSTAFSWFAIVDGWSAPARARVQHAGVYQQHYKQLHP